MPQGIPASYWRSGMLRGTFFRAADLARHQPELRDDIIRSAIGTPPEPDGHAIDGLGGGASRDTSLFKACIIGAPGEGLAEQQASGLLHGPSWVEEGTRQAMGAWDVVFRLAHIHGPTKVAWPDTTCREMLAACAHAAISTEGRPIIPASKLHPYVKAARDACHSQQDSTAPAPVHVPVSILSANTGQVFKARVPIDPLTMQVYEPLETSYDRYLASAKYGARSSAGVAIELEFPLGTSRQLPTGNHIDIITLFGQAIKISVVDVGMPVILVLAETLPELQPPLEHQRAARLPSHYKLIMSKPENLDGHSHLHSLIESIRSEVMSTWPNLQSSPKSTVCVVGDMHSWGYDTVGDRYICSCQADLATQSVSSPGKFDHELSESTLTALAVANRLEGSVVYEAWITAQDRSCGGSKLPAILTDDSKFIWTSAAHPSGVLRAAVRMREGELGRRAEVVILPKTAREIMRGQVLIPERVMHLWNDVPESRFV